MKKRRILTSVLALVLLLILVVGMSQAQGPGGTFDETEALPPAADASPGMEFPEGVEAPQADLTVASDQPQELVAEPQTEQPDEVENATGLDTTLDDKVPVQGRLTDASGTPINGNRSIKFSLYNVTSGGTALCTDIDTVAVSNGLFTAYMDYCSASDLDGHQQLYLGIKVGSDPEMTPRQPIYAVPYARSLRPGAIISNTGSGHGLTVKSSQSAAGGTALQVENTNTSPGGIGVWSLVNGGDASIVASNNGTGLLFKGFGNDGGEDEFRVDNNGAIETKADSYLWIPGNAMIKNKSSDTTRWDVQLNGGVKIWRGSTSGTKSVYFPVTIPAVLYGQPVKIERVTVYYRCQDGSKNYITDTRLYKFTDADSQVPIFTNSTNHTSNSASSYTIAATQNNLLSASQGGLGLFLNIAFADDSNYVQIGGIRLQLGHHDLY